MFVPLLLMLLAAEGEAPRPEIAVIELPPPVAPDLLRPLRADRDYKSWVRSSDYPQDAAREHRTGAVRIMVQVAADDRIERCEILSASGGGDIAALPCQLIARYGRFRHGLAADGSPRGGTSTLDFTFRIRDRAVPLAEPPAPRFDGTPPGPIDPLDLVLRGASIADFPNDTPSAMLQVNAQGRATACVIEASSGSDAGDIALCRHLRGVAFHPGMNRAGVPVAAPLLAVVSVQR